MKETNLIKFIISTFIYVGTMTAAYSGQGIGGGAPPALETEPNFLTLKDAARDISGAEIDSAERLEFFAETDIQVFQQKISRNLMRVAGSLIPGTLTITEDDLSFKIQLQIESEAACLPNIKSAEGSHPLD